MWAPSSRWLGCRCQYRLWQGPRRDLHLNSANLSLFKDTHTTPTNFYDGSFAARSHRQSMSPISMWAGVALDIGVRRGRARKHLRHRRGRAGSYYKEGGQSYPGFPPAGGRQAQPQELCGLYRLCACPDREPAGRYRRPLRALHRFRRRRGRQNHGALRHQAAIAIRGTISTGFRAPTLEEEYYSATNTSPTTATVQLPPNSAAAHCWASPAAAGILHQLQPGCRRPSARRLRSRWMPIPSPSATASSPRHAYRFGRRDQSPIVTQAIALAMCSIRP